MKYAAKLSALIITLLCFSNLVNAQFRFGVKAGGTVSTLTTTSLVLEDIDATLNYQAGAMVQYNIVGSAFKTEGVTPKKVRVKNFWNSLSFGLAVQPELLLSTKGGNIRDADASSYLRVYDDDLEDLKYTSYNINLPLNILFGVKYKKVVYYLLGSPYVSYLAGGQMNGDKTLFSSIDGEFRFNRFDFGLSYGGGVQFNHFQLAVSYDYGLIEIGQKTTTDLNGNYNPFFLMNNRSLNVSLGYFF